MALSLACGGAFAATVGTGAISGVFLDPVGQSNMVVSGINTATVLWGVAAEGSHPSSLKFDGGPFTDQAKGTPFVAGTMAFGNGTIELETGLTDITLAARSFSPDPDFDQIMKTQISVFNSTNSDSNTPEQNADGIYWKNSHDLGTLRVLEGKVGIVEILFAFNSLDLVGFGKVLTPETAFLLDDPFGSVDDDFTVAPIPLPAGLPLLMGAVGLLGLAGFRRKAV